ncbi:MAG: TonB-dependent receptor plug domain-containing protein [Bacteroidales bacterium]|nr:TonB-dependent receptor plug domain-containing protein [Bacteroidales bacterium]
MGTRIIILLTMLLAWQDAAWAQPTTRVVSGQVTTLNDLPVGGVTITTKKTKSSVASDSLGYFSIVCNEKDRLKFDAKVFSTSNVKIKPNTPDSIKVNMRFAQTEKNVELAIGYGYIQEKYRTQAIQYIKRGNDFCSYISIFDILRNHFSNLQIQPGGCVVIRGPSSILGSNCALYVVDGIKTSSIDYISPCEVKEISVLKDASAAAIYGSESANGVILINLKRGEDIN